MAINAKATNESNFFLIRLLDLVSNKVSYFSLSIVFILSFYRFSGSNIQKKEEAAKFCASFLLLIVLYRAMFHTN